MILCSLILPRLPDPRILLYFVLQGFQTHVFHPTVVLPGFQTHVLFCTFVLPGFQTHIFYCTFVLPGFQTQVFYRTCVLPSFQTLIGTSPYPVLKPLLYIPQLAFETAYFFSGKQTRSRYPAAAETSFRAGSNKPPVVLPPCLPCHQSCYHPFCQHLRSAASPGEAAGCGCLVGSLCFFEDFLEIWK